MTLSAEDAAEIAELVDTLVHVAGGVTLAA